MKMAVNYLNFVFLIEAKAKSKYRIFEFRFQFIKNTKWHFGYTGSPVPVTLLMEVRASENFKSTFFIKPYHTTAFGTPFLNNLSD